MYTRRAINLSLSSIRGDNTRSRFKFPREIKGNLADRRIPIAPLLSVKVPQKKLSTFLPASNTVLADLENVRNKLKALENDFKELKEKLKQEPNNKDFLEKEKSLMEKEKLLLRLQSSLQEEKNILLKKEPTEVSILPGLYESIRDCAENPIPWENLKDTVDELPSDDSRVSLAALEGKSWLCVASQNLFIRSCYKKLWEKMDALYKDYDYLAKFRSVLLLGNPGIGKTVALNYFLKQALKSGYRVLFETRDARYFFHDGIAEKESLRGLELVKQRDDPKVLLFHDHQQDQPPPTCNAFTIAAMSPDSKNYSEYVKNRCYRLWMPLPSHEEVIAMNSIEPVFKKQKLLDLLNLYGPIPRSVFSDQPSVTYNQLESRISSFDFEKCRNLGMLVSGELPKSHEGLSWSVLHVTSESPDLQNPTKIDWASKEIMTRVLKMHYSGKRKNLERTIAHQLHNPSSLHQPAGEFQYWSGQMIASGCKLSTFVPYYVGKRQLLKPCSLPPIQLEAHNMLVTRMLPEVQDMVQQEGKLTYATIVNEPLCDAAVITNNSLVLFQMTIGGNHTVKECTFKSYCNKAKEHGLACVRFVFVVPHKTQFSVSQDQVTFFSKTKFGIDVSLEVAELTPSRL